MTQQFTPSTDGQNVSIAAGADPVYTARVRGVNWRPDAMLVLTGAAELRATQFADADTYYVRGVGEVLWDEDDTTADNGTTVFQITGVPTGRYKLTGGSSLLAHLTNGSSVAVSGINTSGARSPAVSGGTLYLPSVSAAGGMHELSQPCAASFDSRKGVTVTDAIDAWVDQSGNASNATAVTTARPTVGVWSDGGAAVAFDKIQQWLAVDGLLPHCQGVQPYSVAALVRFSAVTGSCCIFGGGGGSPNIKALQIVNSEGNIFTMNGNGNTSLVTTGAPFVTTRDQLVMFVSADGTNAASIWIDGKQLAIGDAFGAGTFALTHMAIGATLSGGSTAANFFGGTMRYLAHHPGALTLDDYKKKCREWLGQVHANIVCDGNSLTLGTGSTGGNTYPAHLGTMLGQTAGKCVVTNLGVGAQTTQQMMADYVAQVRPLIRPGSHNVLCVWEVSNDIIMNQITPAAAVANLWAYVDLAVADSWEVFMFTCPPRGDFDGTGDSYKAPARLTEANALILAQALAHGCIDTIDVGSMVQLQSTANTNYFDADTVHLKSPSYAAIASKAAQKIGARLTQI